ncbi:hypothetical protein [Aminiphilus circumscriptus]|uniref:hypothetical protein n=1 Tax=Aminiphilus circumscriptus TaxID=290732 RepID=UPI0004AD9F02|nr:hypothetical protein [Aminiphilus circumscriptus]
MKKHWSPAQVIHREQLFLAVPTVYRRNRPRPSGSDSALASPQRERLRSLVAAPLRSRASTPLAKAVPWILDGAPCSSITVDNGKEFARHARMSKERTSGA